MREMIVSELEGKVVDVYPDRSYAIVVGDTKTKNVYERKPGVSVQMGERLDCVTLFIPMAEGEPVFSSIYGMRKKDGQIIWDLAVDRPVNLHNIYTKDTLEKAAALLHK